MEEKCPAISYLLMYRGSEALVPVSHTSAATFSADGAGIKGILFDTLPVDNNVLVCCIALLGNV
jgi:hypothetical protein